MLIVLIEMHVSTIHTFFCPIRTYFVDGILIFVVGSFVNFKTHFYNYNLKSDHI